MRRCGVRIKEVSLLGFPFPYLPSVYYRRGETSWSLHPFVLGAYVEPYDENEIGSKRLWDQLYISGGGPIANLVYALALSAVAFVLMGARDERLADGLVISAILGVVAWVVWLGRRYIALALPVLAIPILVLVGWAIFGTNPMQAVEAGSGGPVAVVVSLTGAQSTSHALLLAAFLSINLGLINLAPLPPLDGGRIFGATLKAYLGQRAETVYNWVAIPLFVAVIVYSLGLDGIRIWKWIW